MGRPWHAKILSSMRQPDLQGLDVTISVSFAMDVTALHSLLIDALVLVWIFMMPLIPDRSQSM